jgi:site-specific recombinase XerD
MLPRLRIPPGLACPPPTTGSSPAGVAGYLVRRLPCSGTSLADTPLLASRKYFEILGGATSAQAAPVAIRSGATRGMSEPASNLPVLVSPQPDFDLERLQRLLLAGIAAPNSRRAYARALTDFMGWYGQEPRGPFSRLVVEEYRTHLSTRGLAPSTINVRLSAIRKLAEQAAEAGLLSSERALGIQKLKGARKLGIRAGNWLTKEQASQLLHAPDIETLNGKRNRALLALLLGCGLRRTELANLTFNNVQQREGRWVLPDLVGKGGRIRTVPLPAWVKAAIDAWATAAELSDGRVFRAIDKSGRIWGEGITAKVIWWVVLRYAKEVGIAKLAPHDLRRTCAKLCRAAGGDLEQIQLLLGHASVQTTEQYLGTKQNLMEAVNDRLGLEL